MDKLENKTTPVITSVQGDAVAANVGYLVKGSGTSVVAFYVDGWGKTGRIYPMASSSSISIDSVIYNLPSLWVGDGEEGSDLTGIYFPEFEGYEVFCAEGGKTMQVCLVKKD